MVIIMKKKLIAGLLAATMVASVLTGCGSKDSGAVKASGDVDENGVTTENITLTYWHYEDETTIELLAEKFMEKYMKNLPAEKAAVEAL